MEMIEHPDIHWIEKTGYLPEKEDYEKKEEIEDIIGDYERDYAEDMKND